MNIGNLARRAGQFAVNNSPAILTTIGVVGTITTAYLAGKASFEACDIIRLKEGTEGISDDPKQVLKERVQLTWRLYLPAAAVGCATIACVVGANRVSAGRAAGLAAAYSIVERSAEEYRDKVIEKIGVRKEEETRADIIKDRLAEKNWDDDSIEVYGKPEGQIFYDKFSDRFVWTTQEDIRARINDLNKAIVEIGYASLADFYYLMDMPAPAYSHEIGWDANGQLMQARFSSALTPSGKPVNAFEFDTEPDPRYKRFH